ncbi:transposase [Streptomyces lydicus]|uniref:transposase n=1 Tax=Streptomyces lydicus TaxID=47763 RepID=UPI0036C14E2A
MTTGAGDFELTMDELRVVARYVVESAQEVLPAFDAHHRLALIWADGGYTGSLVEYCLAALALVVAIVKRSDDHKGFVVLPKRWIVERLFAHLMRTRRLVRDFERRTSRAEAMVYWSMILLMTRRLARSRPSRA